MYVPTYVYTYCDVMSFHFLEGGRICAFLWHYFINFAFVSFYLCVSQIFCIDLSFFHALSYYEFCRNWRLLYLMNFVSSHQTIDEKRRLASGLTLQLLELTSRLLLFIAFTLAASSIKDPSMPNIGRNSTVTVGIRFFIVFFLVVFFDFMPMPILVLAFIVA